MYIQPNIVLFKESFEGDEKIELVKCTIAGAWRCSRESF
jgi:hypothetical protein